MAEIPIQVWRLPVTQTAADIRRLSEKAAQTFLVGVPVAVEQASGYLIESGAIAAANVLIAGFSLEPGANLAASGTAETLNYGSVQNQPNAQNIPVGAPPNDGMCGVAIADGVTEFMGALAAGSSFAVTDVTKIYGLTKQASGYWAIDLAKANAAAGACIEITQLIDAAGTDGGRAAFKVLQANRQFEQ